MQKLLEPRLAIGIAVVAVLVAMSLFVGQYDILGADKFIVVKDAVAKIEEVYA